VARTDDPLLYGSNPLIQHRVIRAAGSNPMAMAKDTIASLGAMSLNASMATAISSTDKVTSPTAVTITLSGASVTSIEPGSVMWYSDKAQTSMASFGDSLTKGVGTTAYGYSWALQAADLLRDDGKSFSAANYGIGSQTHAASMSTARAVAAQTKPGIATLFAWSPNNLSSTDAQLVTMWTDFLNTCQYLKDLGAVVIALTSPPVNSATGAQNTRRVTQNTRLRAAAASGLCLLVDADEIVRDPGNTAQILPAYNTSGTDGSGGAGTGDGIHWNDLAAAAIAERLVGAIYANSVVD
jgi:lysophospholipase L1-like esterase